MPKPPAPKLTQEQKNAQAAADAAARRAHDAVVRAAKLKAAAAAALKAEKVANGTAAPPKPHQDARLATERAVERALNNREVALQCGRNDAVALALAHVATTRG